MAEKKIWMQQELTCKPLDTYEEILLFLQDPPPWRTLCKKLKPHSEIAIKNININKWSESILLESPQAFCHFDPESEDVKREEKKRLPKTLVCHDMANGYHDDSMIDGSGNHDAYTFYNWAGIDIFIYFSHHLITIPPLGWINVGHAHGVKVLGTVITEWAEGIVFWERVLQSETEWQNLASALVAIAKTLKFDGWLLNVENKISKPDVLLQFVRYLHRTMHQELEDPVLIWYDSVTVDGHLNWQNGLNEKNRAFFDAVDGFFTNYSWREDDIEGSVVAAGERLSDLYVGIDVWGRNFYGGGQFNTQEAVQLVHSYGCSLALFAPAWTHEAMSDEEGDANAVAEADDLDKYERFLLRDRAFWCSIWPFLNTSLPTCLPFQTSFCKGQGKKRRMYGEVLCPVPWYNLRHMQYQPNSALGPHGYLLSTVDNIVGLSRLGLLKNKNGILRYRRSIEESKLDVCNDSKEIVLSLRADSIGDIQEEVIEETTTNERQSVKRKMTRVLRHFFRIKSPKTEGVELDGPREDDNKPSSSAAQTRGRSMVQMSINLRLGNKPTKIRYALGYVPNELECLEPFFEDSFIGGSCLKVNPSDEVSQEHRLSRLFFTDFYVRNTLIACVVTKTLPGHENQFLNVILDVKRDGRQTKVVLVGRSIPHHDDDGSGPGAEVIVQYPIQHSSRADLDDDLNNRPSGGELRNLQRHLLLNEPGFYVPVENAYGWKVRYYEVRVPRSRVTLLCVRGGLRTGPALLGHIGLCEGTVHP